MKSFLEEMTTPVLTILPGGYLQPVGGYVRKTDRVYGAVARAIRRIARRKKTFTRCDVPCRGRAVARLLCRLVAKGELVRVREGRPGRGEQPSVYRRASALRPLTINPQR